MLPAAFIFWMMRSVAIFLISSKFSLAVMFSVKLSVDSIVFDNSGKPALLG